MQSESGRVEPESGVHYRECGDGIVPDGGRECFRFIVADHLNTPGKAIPGRRVNAGSIQRGEYPD